MDYYYKKDLRTGDHLIRKDGTEVILILNTCMGDVLINLDGEITDSFASLNSNYTSKQNPEHNVIKIKRTTIPRKMFKKSDQTFLELWSA